MRLLTDEEMPPLPASGFITLDQLYVRDRAVESAVLERLVPALQKARDTLTDTRIGTWRYMEGSEIYDDFAEAVKAIDAALPQPPTSEGM